MHKNALRKEHPEPRHGREQRDTPKDLFATSLICTKQQKIAITNHSPSIATPGEKRLINRLIRQTLSNLSHCLPKTLLIFDKRHS